MRQNSLDDTFDQKTEEEQLAAKRHDLQRKYRRWTIGIVAILLTAILCLFISQCGANKTDLESSNNTGANRQETPSQETPSQETPSQEIPSPETLPTQLDWSDWMDELPGYATNEDYVIEEQILYRSRTLETTSSTTQNTMDGWELYDTIEGTGEFGNWSDWSVTEVGATDTREVETQTRYRFRDKETTTGSSSTLSGWELYDTTYSWSSYGNWSDWSTTAVSSSDSRKVETKTQYCYRDITYTTSYTDWSPWSSWQDSSVAADDLTQVETRTVYAYYYYQCPNCGAHMHGWGITCPTWAGGCGQATIQSSDWHILWSTTPHSSVAFGDWYGTGHYYAYVDGILVFKWSDGMARGEAVKSQYRYTTRSTQQVANYGSWSSWSDTVYTSSTSREVQTRIAYRYSDRQQIPTYYFWRWGNWSGWSANAVSQTNNRQVETMPYYRYRDRVTVTTYYFKRWGEWSDYSIISIAGNDTVEVETKIQYRYKSK